MPSRPGITSEAINVDFRVDGGCVKRAWKLLYISVGGGAGLARRQIRSPRDENLIDRSGEITSYT